MSSIRYLVAILVLAAVIAGGYFLAAEPTPNAEAQDEGVRFTRSEQCAGCHSEIYEEWKESWHGQAYTDQDVLDLSQNFQDEQCISCHAPVPIWQVGVGERVVERREHREDGVDCISCHLMPDGRVAGVRGLVDAPCRPVVADKLPTAQFCAGCHNQHWTVDEFMASRWSETHTCNTCHMPRENRAIADNGPVREGVATHRFEGGHYLWMLRKAATVKTEVRDGRLYVRVTNSGAGHKMPTDARHRSFNLYVTIRDEEGNLLVDQEEIAEYRLYYRDQHLEPTQIAPFETKVATYDLPAGRKGVATVEFVYCLKPPQKVTKDWTVVETIQQPF
jgi:nitrate/TMAO reductase-like tetraheme cytochrome c subunit